MDEDYDMDEFGDEIDEIEDFDDFSLDEDGEDYASGDIGMSNDEIEIQGAMDGETDAMSGSPIYSGYGSMTNLDELTDEQRDLYDTAYHASYESH